MKILLYIIVSLHYTVIVSLVEHVTIVYHLNCIAIDLFDFA